LISAIIWFTADALSGDIYSQPIIRFWNAGIRFGFFIVVTLLLPALRSLESEKERARVDYLTGTANRRFFFEVAQSEIDRSQR
jgi:GGDEF domain-containing protein